MTDQKPDKPKPPAGGDYALGGAPQGYRTFAEAFKDGGTVFVNLADLRDPDDPAGRTYRQVNAAREHAIPIGALVELDTGARLFVIRHGRDCDGTPLYYLAAAQDGHSAGGFPDECLMLVRP